LKNFTNFKPLKSLRRGLFCPILAAPLNTTKGSGKEADWGWTLSGLGQTLTGQVTIVSKNILAILYRCRKPKIVAIGLKIFF